MKARSVVLLSGGLDSAANLAFAVERDEVALAVTADYGQRAAAREIAAARALCGYYGTEHRVLELPWLGGLGGSALTDPSVRLPHPEPSKLDDARRAAETARAVWVPNRNGVLIAAAAALADRLRAERVVVGFNREEAATFPDNSQAFLDAMSAALRYSTANGVTVHSYTSGWVKREIVGALRDLTRSFPFERVWSCYEGGPSPCGACESCRRFARAMEEA